MQSNPPQAFTPDARPADGAEGAAGASHRNRISELFRRYNDALLRSLTARVGSLHEAQDIAQEAYVKLLALDRPGAVSFLASYLYTTANNLTTDRLRQRAQRRELEPKAFSDSSVFSPSPEPLWDARQRLVLVERALQGLPPKCRMACILRIFHELKYEEIVSHMASAGVAVDVRSVKRYVAFALEHCQRFIEVAEVGRMDRA